MSYLKLPKTTQDHAIGYQSVVQALDNNAALVTDFDVRHSIGIGGNSPHGRPTEALGRHDDILVARSVADFKVDTSIVTPRLTTVVSGVVFGSLAYVRIAAGQWQIFLATPQLFGAVALMKSTASVDQKATCFVSVASTTGPCVYVSTWVIDTGVWVTADLPFSLVVWTQAR